MFVQPTRVRSPRNLWASAVAAALLVVGVIAAAATDHSPGATPSASAVSSLVAARPRSSTESVPAEALGSSTLDARLVFQGPSVGATSPILRVSGWLPSQFAWAAVDVFTGSFRMAALGIPRASDGSFGSTVALDSWQSGAELVAQLSGLDDVQLQPVPLVTVQVSPTDVGQLAIVCPQPFESITGRAMVIVGRTASPDRPVWARLVDSDGRASEAPAITGVTVGEWTSFRVNLDLPDVRSPGLAWLRVWAVSSREARAQAPEIIVPVKLSATPQLASPPVQDDGFAGCQG